MSHEILFTQIYSFSYSRELNIIQWKGVPRIPHNSTTSPPSGPSNDYYNYLAAAEHNYANITF